MHTQDRTPPAIVVTAADRRAERGTATLLPDPEPRPLFCPVISADDHALEPPDLFERRVPAALRDRVPWVWHDEEGVPYWVFDGQGHGIVSMNGAVGRPVAEWTTAPQKFEEFRQGVRDPAARLSDMDVAGVWASLCFPSIPFGFSGSRLAALSDRDAGLAAVRAYNDWMIDEWCAAAPDRYIPCQLPWLPDPAVAASEIRANAARGFRAVSFSENPENQGAPSIHSGEWDVFFDACQESGTVINLHVGSSGKVHAPSPATPPEGREALFPVSGIMTAVDWVYSQVPVRFPELRVVLSEAGIGWLAMVLERLEKLHRRVEAADSWRADSPSPAEVLQRNFWFTSIDDDAAFLTPERLPLSHIMAEVDYPHTDSSWPGTQDILRTTLAGLHPAQVRQVCYENAAALYRHALPSAQLVAGSEMAP
jgi:predicted TIM-barrel fold metal-dependent hydrolase